MWQTDMKQRLSDIQPALKKLEETCRSSELPEQELVDARKLLAGVRTKLSYIITDGSYGAHNNEYLSSILDGAEADIEQCRAMLDKKLNQEARQL